MASGARVRVDDARRAHGQVAAFNNPAFDISTALPTVMLRNEDYGRIARILRGGTQVELEFTIDTSGRVRDVIVGDADPPARFDDAAVTAVSQYRFAPFEEEGRRYARRARLRVRFALQ